MAKATKAQIAARKKFAATFGRKGAPKRPDAENPTRKKRRKPRRRANPVVAAATENPRKRRAKRAKRRDNTWKGEPRKHGKASKKGWGKRRSGGMTTRGTAATRPYAARRSGAGGSGPGYGRDNPKRRRSRKRRDNSWFGEPRRHSKAAKKGARRAARRRSGRRRDNPARGITVHTHMHGTPQVQDNPKRRRKSRRRSNPAGYAPNYVPTSVRQGLLDNPTYSGLFENPMGPYSKDSLIAFGVASAGVGLGLLFARGIDRFVATMKPADSKNGIKANHPWFGKNAVAAINRRPGALRLGVQAGGAVLGIGGAYMLRNKAIAPWLLGGLALGFGSNLLLQLAEWYAMPYLLKIKSADEKTIANRLYVLEQIDTQDKVDAIMEDWATKPALKDQQDQNAPVVSGPLNDSSSPDIATLGRHGGMIGGARKFVADGRVGHCSSCGGDGGHYAGCANCEICNGGGGGVRKCAYTVRSSDRLDLYALAQAAGTDIGTIAAMNGGGSPSEWWFEGNRVTLPESVCRLIEQGAPTTSTPPYSMESPPTTPPPGTSQPISLIQGIPEKLPTQAPAAAPASASPFQNASVANALAGAAD